MENYSEGLATGMALTQGNGYNNGGLGLGGGFLADIIGLVAVAGIFGLGNFGGNGGRGNCATQADLAAGFNNSAVLSSLNDIKLGQAQAINYNNQGFSGLNTAILTGFHGVDNAVCTLGYNIQSGFNGLSHQLSDCCCQTQRAIDGVNYNIATQFGALNNTLCNLGRDIIENQNANYRALHDENVAMRIEAKDEKIADLQNKLYRADLTASQKEQTLDLKYYIDKLNPNRCPEPAYIVQPPQQVTFPTNCCGTVNFASNGCGCGCN